MGLVDRGPRLERAVHGGDGTLPPLGRDGGQVIADRRPCGNGTCQVRFRPAEGGSAVGVGVLRLRRVVVEAVVERVRVRDLGRPPHRVEGHHEVRAGQLPRQAGARGGPLAHRSAEPVCRARAARHRVPCRSHVDAVVQYSLGRQRMPADGFNHVDSPPRARRCSREALAVRRARRVAAAQVRLVGEQDGVRLGHR